MQQESLWRHFKIHNEGVKQYLFREAIVSATFWVDVQRGHRNGCPVPGCGGSARDPFEMRQYFMFCHPRTMVTVTGEEETTHCVMCRMSVLDVTRHTGSAMCR